MRRRNFFSVGSDTSDVNPGEGRKPGASVKIRAGRRFILGAAAAGVALLLVTLYLARLSNDVTYQHDVWPICYAGLMIFLVAMLLFAISAYNVWVRVRERGLGPAWQSARVPIIRRWKWSLAAGVLALVAFALVDYYKFNNQMCFTFGMVFIVAIVYVIVWFSGPR